jgi:predicted metal-dependent phosphoesterase TrpH
LRWCQAKRVERIARICVRLTDAGLPTDYEGVLRFAGPGSVGRPHVALAMIERGYVEAIGEAFSRYLGKGRAGYVERENVEPATAVSIIRAAGGAAVMAHPLAAGSFQLLLPDLIDAGLAGLEAWYGEYDQTNRERIAGVAARNGLIATGGSDYHGDRFKEGRDLGSVDVPFGVVSELRAAARAGSIQAA